MPAANWMKYYNSGILELKFGCCQFEVRMFYVNELMVSKY